MRCRVCLRIYSVTTVSSPVRALRELEKQLIEYDLNAELILVYKTLAQLHLYSEEYDVYETKFNKHVALAIRN